MNGHVANTATELMLPRGIGLATRDEGPLDAQLAQILGALQRTPQRSDLRAWECIFVREGGRRLLARLLVEAAQRRTPEVAADTLRRLRDRVMLAPLVIGLGANIALHGHLPGPQQMLAVGAIAMNILNTVHALGHGASWAPGMDRCDAATIAALGFTAQVRPAGFIFVGMPGEGGSVLHRQPHGAMVRNGPVHGGVPA